MRPSWGFLFVQTVDEAGTVELFQKPGVDEIFWVGGARGGDFFGELVEDGLEAFQRGIRLYRNQASWQFPSKCNIRKRLEEFGLERLELLERHWRIESSDSFQPTLVR
jgi:hypothetical protein